jgi:GNAT superfamily N-acetyltransferase
MIRPAEPDDLQVLCALYLEFHEFHVRGVPDRLASLGTPETFDCSELCAALDKIMHGDDSALVVAESGGRLVGLAEVYLRHDEPDPAAVACCYGYVQSLMVDPVFRRQGIAAQLMAAAEGWAQEHGAAEMRLQTWEFDGGPLPFYQRLGYRTLRRTLVRDL